MAEAPQNLSPLDSVPRGGPIDFMARNPVASNLLMVLLLVVGVFMVLYNVKQEVFPEVSLDTVLVSVPYPGASPDEVERGILLSIEERVRGIDGVKKVTSIATEGLGRVFIEILEGEDQSRLLQDVKNRIDSIRTFPGDAEDPIVSLLTNQRGVITIALYGDVEPTHLKTLAEDIRHRLLAKDGITLVDITGLPAMELHIEVPQPILRAHNLTLDGIALEVRRAALDLPGGGVKTQQGEILVRLRERRDFATEFRTIPIISGADGTRLLLGDIARVEYGFADTDEAIQYDGAPAILVQIYRTGAERPLPISDTVHDFVAQLKAELPTGLHTTTINDTAETYRGRVELLQRNAVIGLVLLLVMLGLFLEIKLAFWVVVGIAVSFLGGIFMMPWYDNFSINMISVFAFIIALGIVVDDAIVVGENIHELRDQGYSYEDAASLGTQQVALPVTFSVLTNIVAFIPMFFVPGVSGKFFIQIPAVVVSVFIVSLVESLYILPAHLAHQTPTRNSVILGRIHHMQQRVSRFLTYLIHTYYQPVLNHVLRYRYISVAVAIAVLFIIVGMVVGGRVEFSNFPHIESDIIKCTATLPFAAPLSEVKAVQARINQAAQEVLARYGGEKVSRGIITQIGGVNIFGGGGGPVGLSASNIAKIYLQLVSVDQRSFTATEFLHAWRTQIGDIPGVQTLTFKADLGGPAAGSAIDFQLSHTDKDILEAAARDMAARLKTYSNARDINDGIALGKPQFDITGRPVLRSLNLTNFDLGRQLRSAFYGAEALRQQRGRDEIKVLVRLAKDERHSAYGIEELLVRTPGGGEIPLGEAARLKAGFSFTNIKRIDGRQVLNVTAEVRQASQSNRIMDEITLTVLPELKAKYPGLAYSIEGERRDFVDAIQRLLRGLLIALCVIFAMLAIPFRSYTQPLIIMVSVPFGIIGAVLGHVVMGYEVSIISVFGIVALSGVVVNDSLVLIEFANRTRAKDMSAMDAIRTAGLRRFRPIMLTSITTFGGLAPMIFETDMQARFLIPMAISLGYGILFATLIALLLVPALYVILDDIKMFFDSKRNAKSSSL